MTTQSQRLDPIMKRDAVLAATGIWMGTLHRYVRSGKFPAPIQITEKSIGWKQSIVQDWIDNRPVA